MARSRERQPVDLLLQELEDGWKADPNPNDPPDFILRRPDPRRTVGLEVTECLHGNPTGNRRLYTSALRQRFERAVSERLRELGLSGATLTIDWKGGYEPPRFDRRVDVEATARALAEVIHPSIGQLLAGGSAANDFQFARFRETDLGTAATHLDGLIVTYGASFAGCPPWVVSMYDLQPVELPDIVATIERKEQDLSRWSVVCHERWLLVTLDLDAARLAIAPPRLTLQTAFNQVWLFDVRSGLHLLLDGVPRNPPP